MKYFFDCEFIEDGKTIDLISLGIVNEDGTRTLYVQNSECSFEHASEWVWRNVYPHLLHFDMRGRRACSQRHETYDSGLGHRYITKCSTETVNYCPWATRDEIRDAVIAFCDPDIYGKPEFWGYYADYDWVVFCQLFGSMINLPKRYPMYCRDIKQWCDTLGNPKLPEPGKGEHSAILDAQWNGRAWTFLKQIEAEQQLASHSPVL